MNPVRNSETLPVAIIGGGITGLAAAHRLARQGRAFRLFEASPRLGGNIRSEREGDWLHEAGPNSLQLTPPVAALLSELDLAPLTASPAAKNRYIVRDGRPVAAPTSPPAFFTSPLFSGIAKLQLLIEVFSRRRNRTADVSLADFVADHFGSELVDYGLRPFVSGIYAGNAQKLSARHSFPSLWEAERTHGSLIRAQLASAKAKRARGEPSGPSPIVNFTDGLETLPRALAARLPAGSVELNARVTEIVPGQPWKLYWKDSHQVSHTETFSSVVLAVPAAALSELTIGPMGERPLSALSDVEYPPVSSLFLGYRCEQVTHPLDGFGMLVPPAESRSILGVLFNSTLFPGRAPAGHVALTVMSGGALRPDLARLDEPSLLTLVQKELSELLGVSGAPAFIRRSFWAHAIPQYNLGYERFLDLIARTEAARPGLLIGGHVRDGISLPNCLAAGEKLAVRALA
ncbi:protoporphyrinogen oxidase [Rariglobus hedericola]|uniref:protoporphyrinogen oxidase n=1 Tax=Rariglobus hedericola TaxID=2597822 RepID=UPI001EEFD5F6|nr:protoporphyrinogen oxidase [Rariglobus hedericola]